MSRKSHNPKSYSKLKNLILIAEVWWEKCLILALHIFCSTALGLLSYFAFQGTPNIIN